VAKAYDHATKAAVDVRTRVFRVDVEGETCTSKIAECGCVEQVEGGGNASCMVNKVDFTKRSTYLFKYDATDRAGNHAEQVVFALILDDVHKPVISLCQSPHADTETSTPSVERVEGAADWKLCPGTEASDNIDGDISDKVVYDIQEKTAAGFVFRAQNKPYKQVEGLLSSDNVGEYLLTAKVCDAAGVYGQNSMDNCVEASKDIIIEDKANPWIVLHGEPDATQECNVEYEDQGASAYDALDTVANGKHINVMVSGWGADPNPQTTLNKGRDNVHVTIDHPTTGEKKIYYNAKDSANNPADQVTRTVTVHDTTKPVIALKSTEVEIHYQGDPFVDSGITCVDSCDGDIDTTTPEGKWIQCPGHELKLPLVLGSDDTPMSNPDITACEFNDQKLGDYVRLYRCNDSSGNANWITRRYVVRDNKAPEITVQGLGEPSPECVAEAVKEGIPTPTACETYDASRTVEYTDKGATCTDSQLGDASTLSRAVEVSGQVVNMKVPGLYVIRYDCQDDSGNQAAHMTRGIHVVDHSCPEITMQGDQINYVEAGFPYVDAGATATDDLDGPITEAVCDKMTADGKPACTPIWTDGDTVDVGFYQMRSCREIKEEYKVSGGSPSTGWYTITTHASAAFTHQRVWCDFHSDEDKAYTYYMCTECAQAMRDGSTQGDCAKVGLEMAAFHSAGAKLKFAAKFWEHSNQSSEYLCSTNDESNTMSAVRKNAIVKTDTHSAEAGTYVISYHVADSSKNRECASPKRTVIVRDTLPPVISLHLDKKLIHVSDSTQTGLGDGTNHDAAPVNPAGGLAQKYHDTHVKDSLMAEQSSASSNAWLVAAAASAVTGLALLSASSKRAPVSVPV
jgi:hypothetical protein